MIINFKRCESKEDLKRLFTLLLSLDYSKIITSSPYYVFTKDTPRKEVIDSLVSYFMEIDRSFRVHYIDSEISIFSIRGDIDFLNYEDVSEFIEKYKYLPGDMVRLKQDNTVCKVSGISVKYDRLNKYILLYNLKDLKNNISFLDKSPEALIEYKGECIGYQCLICGKIFEKPMPHHCKTGFVKHKLQFNPLYTDMEIKIPAGYKVCFGEEDNSIKIVKE